MDLSKELPDEKELALVFKELLGGTDRSAALIGGTMVENALRHALHHHFVALDDVGWKMVFASPTAPLRTFDSLIVLGFATGIYDESILKVLRTVKALRNVFAHSFKSITFKHPMVMEECADLPPGISLGADHRKRLNKTRANYIAVCLDLFHMLIDHSRRFRTPVLVDLKRFPVKDPQHLKINAGGPRSNDS